ncbi:MAG: SCO family protein [Acidobacteria bacterium]|nr:SCO family protein [Acidobacteriota bacterium]
MPDVMVWTQEGRKVRFYSDLVQDRVVAINFIFTACTTICPPMAATFSKMQDLLGDRLGREVYLISVSVDPANDTPDRLKAWGQKFRAQPGWTFVTGPKGEMDRLLRALDAYTAQKENHSPLVLIGNDRKKRWTRAYGLAPASTLAELIQKESAASPEEMDKQEAKPK